MSKYGRTLISPLVHSGGYLFTSVSVLKEVDNVQRNGRSTRKATIQIVAMRMILLHAVSFPERTRI